MKEPNPIALLYGTIMETWSSVKWMSELWGLPRALESEQEFPRICWNPDPEANMNSSQTAPPFQAGWYLVRCLSSLSFRCNIAALGQN